MEISVFNVDELILKLELSYSIAYIQNIKQGKEEEPSKKELSKLVNECCESTYKTQIIDAWQRAERGFRDHDAFYIGDWFLTIIPEMLEMFKKKQISSPILPGTNDETCHGEWDKILNKMIFLFRECREETCTMKNPYEEEYSEASSEKDITGYKDIHDKYDEEESNISEYREKCRLEAMELFTKWMKNLLG